jgi:serine/threonine protein kinase
MDQSSSSLSRLRNRVAALPAGDELATNDLRRAANDDGPMSTLNPVRVPGYEIGDELGRGGMGVVYRAHQVGLNRIVALKMTLPGVHRDVEGWNRFFEEAETVASLHHPHIVHIHEIGVQDGRPYFSMEFADGGSLAAYLCNQPQPPDEAAALVEILADAVHAAHQHAVVHRDLKPGNVLLFRNDRREEDALSEVAPLTAFTPKITDFGLAKRLDRATGLTQTGCVMGTPGYMAPEQVAGHSRAVGTAVDVYALGAILYECLTGHAPFAGIHSTADLLAMMEVDPAAPSRYQPNLPRDLDTICLKCLQKEPKNRYGSAAELAEDLRRFRTGRPILARPTSAAEHVWRWCRRKPTMAAMAAALVLVFVTGLPGVTALWLAADANRRTAESRSHDLDVEKKNVQVALDREADARASGLRQIARMETITGGRLLGEGDLLGALPYFAEALHLDRQAQRGTAADSDREQFHRQRLGAVLQQCPPLLHIWFLDGAVRDATFSADGRKILTADSGGTARVWDARTGTALTPPLPHIYEVSQARFSRDGRRVVTVSRPGVRLWDVETGDEIPSKTRGVAGRLGPSPCPGDNVSRTGASRPGALSGMAGRGVGAGKRQAADALARPCRDGRLGRVLPRRPPVRDPHDGGPPPPP